MQKSVVCVVCEKSTLQVKIENQLKPHFKLMHAQTVHFLQEVLKKKEVACIVACPIEDWSCRLWEFRKIKQDFELIPIIIACPCVQVDFIGACVDSFGDDLVDYDEIESIREKVQNAIDRRDFHRQFLDEDQIDGRFPRIKKALALTHLRFTRFKYAEDVSRHLGIQVSTFRKEFKESCGTSFTQYLIRLKLLYATYLAQNKGLVGKAISRRCGFSDEHEFYRAFKRKIGMPFSEYRSKYSFEDFERFYDKNHK